MNAGVIVVLMLRYDCLADQMRKQRQSIDFYDNGAAEISR